MERRESGDGESGGGWALGMRRDGGPLIDCRHSLQGPD